MTTIMLTSSIDDRKAEKVDYHEKYRGNWLEKEFGSPEITRDNDQCCSGT